MIASSQPLNTNFQIEFKDFNNLVEDIMQIANNHNAIRHNPINNTPLPQRKIRPARLAKNKKAPINEDYTLDEEEDKESEEDYESVSEPEDISPKNPVI
jgi:hypothetical protein